MVEVVMKNRLLLVLIVGGCAPPSLPSKLADVGPKQVVATSTVSIDEVNEERRWIRECMFWAEHTFPGQSALFEPSKHIITVGERRIYAQKCGNPVYTHCVDWVVK